MKSIFDYTTMTIDWENHQYPFKEIELENQSAYILISTMQLEQQLLNHDGLPKNGEAAWLDNQICFYVDTPQQLNLPAKAIIDMIYG